MSITLDRFTSGMTDYITKHNSNASVLETAINPLQADVDALRAAGAPGGDLDYRQGTSNLLINGGLDYWQRGAGVRPDAWLLASGAVIRSVTKKLNTYSIKTTGLSQLTQDLQDEIRLSIDDTISLSYGVYVYADVADNTRIGIYDGITTQYSGYHPGDSTWIWLTKNITFTAIPTTLRFVLDSASGTSYFNAAIVIRGNPASGPIFIANDPTVEHVRVNSLYEIGSTNIRGVGFLNSGDRELEKRIEFIAPKRTTPTITIVDDDTGYDFLAYNIDRHGFNLLVSEVGGASGTSGFEYNDIDWIAEVSGT